MVATEPDEGLSIPLMEFAGKILSSSGIVVIGLSIPLMEFTDENIDRYLHDCNIVPFNSIDGIPDYILGKHSEMEIVTFNSIDGIHLPSKYLVQRVKIEKTFNSIDGIHPRKHVVARRMDKVPFNSIDGIRLGAYRFATATRLRFRFQFH